MKQQLLLLEDVEGLGRGGDVVSAKPGYVRNYLLPKKFAVIADKHTLRMKEKLQKERAEKAEKDRVESEEIASRLVGFTLTKEVKVDPEGNMYGSVTAYDIAFMLQEKGYKIEKRFIALAHPIKTTGSHKITLKLPEGVPATFLLDVVGETVEA